MGEKPGWDACVGRHGKVSAKSRSVLRRSKRERAPALQRGLLGKLSGGFGEGVVEVVGMLAIGDVNGHLAGEADQLARARIRYDGDGLLRCAPRQSAAVLEHEAADATLERSSDPLDGDVAGRAFDVRSGGQHL